MKSLYEQFGGTDNQEGDYLIPDLVPPPSPHIGIWGERRRQYLHWLGSQRQAECPSGGGKSPGGRNAFAVGRSDGPR